MPLPDEISKDEATAVSLCRAAVNLMTESSKLHKRYFELETSYVESVIDRQKSVISHNNAIYSSQRVQTIVIFMTVILIVLGGFAAAFYELMAAAKLREKGNKQKSETDKEAQENNSLQDIDITLSYNKIAVKTTQNGITIFLITLLFFMIYIRFVYPITSAPKVEQTSSQQIVQCDPDEDEGC